MLIVGFPSCLLIDIFLYILHYHFIFKLRNILDFMGEYNEGHSLAYLNDKKHVEQITGDNQGVMFYDNLEGLADKIAKRFVHAEWVRDEYGNVINYFFDPAGGFASVGRRSKPELPVFNVKFVNKTSYGLELTVKSFDLPFDLSKVRTPQ